MEILVDILANMYYIVYIKTEEIHLSIKMKDCLRCGSNYQLSWRERIKILVYFILSKVGYY